MEEACNSKSLSSIEDTAEILKYPFDTLEGSPRKPCCVEPKLPIWRPYEQTSEESGSDEPLKQTILITEIEESPSAVEKVKPNTPAPLEKQELAMIRAMMPARMLEEIFPLEFRFPSPSKPGLGSKTGNKGSCSLLAIQDSFSMNTEDTIMEEACNSSTLSSIEDTAKILKYPFDTLKLCCCEEPELPSWHLYEQTSDESASDEPSVPATVITPSMLPLKQTVLERVMSESLAKPPSAVEKVKPKTPASSVKQELSVNHEEKPPGIPEKMFTRVSLAPQSEPRLELKPGNEGSRSLLAIQDCLPMILPAGTIPLSAESGNVELEKQQLETDVNNVNKHRLDHLTEIKYLLTEAIKVKFGNETITNMLQDAMAKAELEMVEGMAALQMGAKTDRNEVDTLMEKVPRVSIHNHDGFNRLHYAAVHNRHESVRLMLPACSTEVKNQKAPNGYTALHMAAHHGFEDTARAILNDEEVEINLRDLDNCTPLMLAIKSRKENVALLLIANGAEFHQRDNHDYTALHLAAYTGCSVAVVGELLARGDESNSLLGSTSSFTPLHLAAHQGHNDIVRALLQGGANVNQADQAKWTALHMCAARGFIDIVHTLLDNGALVDPASIQGSTPLMVAIDHCQAEVACLLMDSGANIKAGNDDGFTPLHFAAEHGLLLVVNFLLRRRALVDPKAFETGATPLYLAVKKGHLEVVKRLLDLGADPNPSMLFNFTPLHVAIMNNHPEVVRQLVNSGAILDCVASISSNTYIPMSFANTPKHFEIRTIFDQVYDMFEAVFSNDLETVKDYLNQGDSGNYLSHDLSTPLLVAVRNGFTDIARLLMDTGVPLYHFDHKGMAAIHYAVLYNDYPLLLAMLSKGAEFDLPTEDGRCRLPIDMAAGQKNPAIAKVLRTLTEAFVLVAKGDVGVVDLMQTVNKNCQEEFLAMMSARQTGGGGLKDTALKAGLDIACGHSTLKK